MTPTSKPFAPMLATEILSSPYGKIRVLDHYLKDYNWGISQKVDGKRMMVLTARDEYQVFNRKGELITPNLPPFLHESLSSLGSGYLLDGEYLNDEYILFDLVQSPDNVGITPDSPYVERYEMLNALATVWEPESIHVLPFIHASGIFEEKNEDPFGWPSIASMNKIKEDMAVPKRAFFNLLKNNNAEGAIFRSNEGMYKFGSGSTNLLKFKFWNTIDCIAYNPGRHDKLSVGVAVLEDGEPVDIGAVTVTEDVLRSIQPGAVLEVKYLYATESRRLFQSSLLRIRDDKSPEECTIDQLRYTNKKVINDDNLS